MSTSVQSESLGHLPEGPWAFDESVAGCFDDMLLRSIPQFAVMRQACTDLARAFRTMHSDVVDIGCSLGGAIAPLVHEEAWKANRFVGLEVSGPMLERARQRFAQSIEQGKVDLRPWDLRDGYPADLHASVTFSILTVQFTPIEHRLRLLDDIYRSTLPGGVLLFVEKLLGASATIDRVMVERYYAFKEESGYTREEIERKRLSLEGVLVPMPARFNEELLRSVGFRQVDCFWRWFNFAGWLAIK